MNEVFMIVLSITDSSVNARAYRVTDENLFETIIDNNGNIYYYSKRYDEDNEDFDGEFIFDAVKKSELIDTVPLFPGSNTSIITVFDFDE